MLKHMEFTNPNERMRRQLLKFLSALVVVLLLVAVSATILNNVIATPASPRELQIRDWVSALGDTGLTAKRQEAQAQLEKAGAEAVPALMTALRSNDVNVRKNAADVLGYIASPTATTALTTSLANDPAAAVRANAAWALGEIRDAGAWTALQSASVLDTSPQVRENANNSLAGIQNGLIAQAGRDASQVNVITAAPNQPGTLYLASQRDLLVSRNNGATWETSNQALPSVASALVVNPTNPNILYAGMHSEGMYLSTDGGHNWQSLTRNFSNQAIGQSTVTAIAVDPQDPMRVVMAHGIRVGGTGTDFFPLGILSSKDGGKTWGNVMDLQEGQLVTRLEVRNGKVYALTADKVLIAPLN